MEMLLHGIYDHPVLFASVFFTGFVYAWLVSICFAWLDDKYDLIPVSDNGFKTFGKYLFLAFFWYIAVPVLLIFHQKK